MKRLLPLLLFLSACSVIPGLHDEREAYFLREVKPVLQTHCLSCHNGSVLRPPALNLTSAATAFTRNLSGRDYILPGDPDCSLLIGAIQRYGTHPKLMPRAEVSLTDDEIGMLHEWIEDGAYWPKGEQGRLQAVKATAE
jgi:uncharacterized membrane protein